MADKEYIERQGYIDKLKFKRDNGIDRGNKYPGLESAIAQAQKYPAADVAPRSEVAREIFEELETILAKNLAMGSSVGPALYYRVNEIDEQIEALKKKYMGERLVALDDKLVDATERSAETVARDGKGMDEYVKE